MDADTDTPAPQAIWIDWLNQVLSFHPVIGYERLDFASYEAKMNYAVQKSAMGFRIQ